MAPRPPIEEVDALSGRDYLAFRKAVEVVELDDSALSTYRLRAIRDDVSTYIILAPAAPPGEAEIDERGVAINRKTGTATELGPDRVAGLGSKRPPPETVATIPGTSFLALRAAAKVFADRLPNQDLARYTLTLVKRPGMAVVILNHEDRPKGTFGNTPKHPSLEVRLDLEDYRVLGSSFVR